MDSQNLRSVLSDACGRIGPACLIRESDKTLLYANQYIQDRLGRDPAGEFCYQVFMGACAPCPFCPEAGAEGTQYKWEYFSPDQARLYSVTHLYTQWEGAPCRACQADDVSEVMSLSSSAVGYLALSKSLSEMQAAIIQNPGHTPEIITHALLNQTKAAQVAVSCPEREGTLVYLAEEGCPVRQLTLPEDADCLSALLDQPPDLLLVGDTNYELRVVSPASPDEWEENRPIVLYIVRLYLENARMREQIEWENHHDRATGLYNRAHFMQQSRTEYTALHQAGVIFVDIDNLKKINDEYGHDMGDRLIRKAANILNTVGGGEIHPYRMGGDEFVLVCCEAESAAVEALVDTVMEAMGESNDLIPMPELSISIGWSHGTAPFSLETLVNTADEMMYTAKRAKKAAR